MSNDNKTHSVARCYDCSNGGAEFCHGCYTMERDDEYGDYVTYEDYATLQAKLERAVEFAQHKPSCRKIREQYWAAKCTCGLDAFLAEINAQRLLLEKEKNDD